MKIHAKNGGRKGDAARKAGVHRQTAVRYLNGKKGPTQIRSERAPRDYRRRIDPLAGLWNEALTWLQCSPEIDAKALFEHLLSHNREWAEFASGALRTFQRRVQGWRTKHGPEKEVYFPQVREPGTSIQFDWTHAAELEVTIAGMPFEHLLAHAVLPYSNWEWAVPCKSQSGMSLKRGLQDALWALGGVPRQCKTDQSSTATHTLKRGDKARGLNTEYLALCKHLGLEARATHVRSPNENGDVESSQMHLKRRLRNHLILRGSRDFRDEAEYGAFVAKVCTAANAVRGERVVQELATLKALPKHDSRRPRS